MLSRYCALGARPACCPNAPRREKTGFLLSMECLRICNCAKPNDRPPPRCSLPPADLPSRPSTPDRPGRPSAVQPTRQAQRRPAHPTGPAGRAGPAGPVGHLRTPRHAGRLPRPVYRPAPSKTPPQPGPEAPSHVSVPIATGHLHHPLAVHQWPVAHSGRTATPSRVGRPLVVPSRRTARGAGPSPPAEGAGPLPPAEGTPASPARRLQPGGLPPAGWAFGASWDQRACQDELDETGRTSAQLRVNDRCPRSESNRHEQLF